MPVERIDLGLDALMPKRFVDRTELQDIVSFSISKLLNCDNYHEIIAIYGIGGIGKSRFLTEVRRSFPQWAELIYVTLELDCDDVFHSLICIRRKILHTCYLFDYALAMLLDNCVVEKVSDEFMNHLRTNWGADLITFFQGLSPIPMPGVNDGIDVLRRLIDTAIKAKTKFLYQDTIRQLEILSNTSPKKLFEILPRLLGNDLGRIANGNKLIVVLDACNGCRTWLSALLSEAKSGVFILTSREQMFLDSLNIKTYHMQEIPVEEAERYLKAYITNEQHQSILIPRLISMTECIPIYLDLAVSTYLRCESKSEQDLIANLSFENKDELVRAFLDHLPDEQQSIILVLAVVEVFDVNIFEYLVSDLNLSASKLSYHELCKISLVDSLNTNCDLKTFHNIFCKNVSKILPKSKKYRIFQSYLMFLSHRGLYIYPNERLRTYFLNILNLIVDNGFELTVRENEEILDLFFALSDERIEFSFPNISPDTVNGTLFTFLFAVTVFHSDSSLCLAKLNSIRSSSSLLGKHVNSYYAVQYYSMGIEGQYSKVKRKLVAICDSLPQDSIMDWYYGKLKIYLADCMMLAGDFRNSIFHFDEYYNEIEPYANLKENDIFEIQKQKGHCYRFNFAIDEALNIYSHLYRKYANNAVMKSYCLTCLCETNCFFNPQYVIGNQKRCIDAVKAVGQERSRAKIYYALGIAYTVVHDFTNAYRYIRESIKLNEKCHYPAGKLFALISKSYFHYARDGYVPKRLVIEITELTKRLGVYEYLLVPLYLILQEENNLLRLEETYCWLDWEKTREKCKKFIDSLSS